MSVQKIALLGTGLMGAPMARNLCQAGVDTTVWNRTANKAKHLAHFGATVAQSAAGAVAQADIVISMLSDGPTGVMVQSDPDVRASLKAGAIWVEMGSIKPEEARASAANLAQLNVGIMWMLRCLEVPRVLKRQASPLWLVVLHRILQL